jgi:ribosome-associated protein
MDSRKLALLCREYAENKKAENIVVLDVRNLSSITDYFVIVSGATEPHLRAIGSEITDSLRKLHDVRPRAVEGESHSPWQVVDFFDVIVHIMRTDLRERYNLESLWGDAPRVGNEPEPVEAKPAKTVKTVKAAKTTKTAKAATTDKAEITVKVAKPRKPRAAAKVKKTSKKKSTDSEAAK